MTQIRSIHEFQQFILSFKFPNQKHIWCSFSGWTFCCPIYRLPFESFLFLCVTCSRLEVIKFRLSSQFPKMQSIFFPILCLIKISIPSKNQGTTTRILIIVVSLHHPQFFCFSLIEVCFSSLLCFLFHFVFESFFITFDWECLLAISTFRCAN